MSQGQWVPNEVYGYKMDTCGPKVGHMSLTENQVVRGYKMDTCDPKVGHRSLTEKQVVRGYKIDLK